MWIHSTPKYIMKTSDVAGGVWYVSIFVWLRLCGFFFWAIEWGMKTARLIKSRATRNRSAYGPFWKTGFGDNRSTWARWKAWDVRWFRDALCMEHDICLFVYIYMYQTKSEANRVFWRRKISYFTNCERFFFCLRKT